MLPGKALPGLCHSVLLSVVGIPPLVQPCACRQQCAGFRIVNSRKIQYKQFGARRQLPVSHKARAGDLMDIGKGVSAVYTTGP
jgi:hypothetical protein